MTKPRITQNLGALPPIINRSLPSPTNTAVTKIQSFNSELAENQNIYGDESKSLTSRQEHVRLFTPITIIT